MALRLCLCTRQEEQEGLCVPILNFNLMNYYTPLMFLIVVGSSKFLHSQLGMRCPRPVWPVISCLGLMSGDKLFH